MDSVQGFENPSSAKILTLNSFMLVFACFNHEPAKYFSTVFSVDTMSDNQIISFPRSRVYKVQLSLQYFI